MPWGAIGAIGGAIAGSLLSRWNSQEAMEDQAWYNRDAQIWSARELPTIQVEGMRKAGVNPMLAYGNLGSVNSPSSSAVVADTPDFVGAGSEIGKAVTRNSAIKLQKQELENKKSEKELTESQKNYYDEMAKNVGLKKYGLDPEDPVGSAKRLVDNFLKHGKLTETDKDEIRRDTVLESHQRGYDRPASQADKDALHKRAQVIHDAQRRAEEQRARVRAKREGSYHDRRPVDHGYNKHGKK